MRQIISLFILILFMNYYGFSQSLPFSIEIKKVALKNFEIIIRDSTDGFDESENDIYHHSTTTINLVNDTLNNLVFENKVFGFVVAKPNGDSIIKPFVSFSLKENKIELFVFFKTKHYGSKLYNIQGILDLKNGFVNFTGINLIMNDYIERVYFFKNNKVCLITYFNDESLGPFLLPDSK